MTCLPKRFHKKNKMARAKAVFSDLGYSGPVTCQVQAYPGGPPAGDQTSFVIKFGSDADKAAELVLAILNKVYGLHDDARLKLTEE